MRKTVPTPHSFLYTLQASVALLLIIIALFFYYVWTEKQISAANERHYQTRLVLDQIRQNSDESARLVRSFVITGDDTYLANFQTLQQVLNGKLRKPQNYDNIIWDYLTAKSDLKSNDLSLLSLIQTLGFTDNELHKLEAVENKADELAKTEFKAINLIKDAPAENKSGRIQAQMLVFDPEYHQQKAEIAQLIDETTELSEHRTQAAITEAVEWANLMRGLLIGLGIVLGLLLWQCEKMFRNTLGAAPEIVYETIRQLGDEQLPHCPLMDSFPEHSVMSHLVQAQVQLQVLENERQKNQQSMLLMSKVFSDAQEGIFLTDAEGIVLDINLAFLNMTGYGRSECIGHPSLIFRTEHQDKAFFDNFWHEVKQNGRWRGEIWCRNKTGELIACILNFSTVNDSEEHLLCYLGMVTDITQLKMHQQEIEQIAYHDPLTQLPNRPLLADRMRQALARVERTNGMLAIACLDLDGFKAVNDSFGHGMGDALLIEVAQRLLGCVRSCDTVARLGGDEFVILLCEINNRDQCEVTLQRVLRSLVAPYKLLGHQISKLSGSIGYTLYPFDNVDPDTLLRHADHAMYQAKQAGKNRFHYFDIREDKRAQANWSALARIERALTNNEFCLHVQPKVNLRTGELVGGEALIRWLHPIRGLIPPSQFLPLIEDHDISIEIGHWVIEESLKQMKAWREQGLILPLSINISARHLQQDNFSERISNVIAQYPTLPKGQLEIEIVESAALDDLQKASQVIADCKTLGVNFALDDFGTGYSALTYLKRLAVNTLKIDQTFVRDVLIDDSSQAIVRGVIGLAKAFDTELIAEGVENWQQAACLLALGCEVIQGFAIAHPMPAHMVADWARDFIMPDLSGDQHD